MSSYDEDEIMRAVLEESLRTAAEEERRKQTYAQRAAQPDGSQIPLPSAPTCQQSIDYSGASGNAASGLTWEQQRLEALQRQRQRWEQVHGQHPQSEQSASDISGHPGSVGPPSYGTAQHSSTSLYPSIPSALPDLGPGQMQSVQQQADISEEQRKRQQEEEDHRLALQLAEAFAHEEADAGQLAGQDSIYNSADSTSRGDNSETNDEDWEQITRSASEQLQAEAADARTNSARPTSQAAAAAGSSMGGLVGAGLSALLAMAAHAASGSHADATAAAHSTDAAASRPGPSATSSTAVPGGDASSSNQGPGFLRFAASALRNYLAGRNQSSSSSSATAATSSHQGAGSRSASDQPDGAVSLQQLMQQMLTGNAASSTNAAAGASRDANQGSGSGFRMVHLPGGGYAVSYSRSSAGDNSSNWQHSEHAGPGFPMFADEADPFGFMGPDDFFSQLLLAGARSAHGNYRRQQQQEGVGFTHYDPSAGVQGRFEPLGLDDSAAGIEALFHALMGNGMFGGGELRAGSGGFRYEDLVGLDPVHVSTPEDVLSSLPKSTYVEGRKPGDSDTCVICQTAYSAGEELMHLPCLHAFHADCITPWLQGHSKKCPVCKTDVC